MPRKTKEQIDEPKDVEKKKITTTKKSNEKIVTVEKEPKSTKTTAKKTTTKKTSAKKTTDEEEPKTTKKTTTKTSAKKSSSKKATVEKEPKPTKTTTKKVSTKKSSSKKVATNEETKTTKKATSKKTTTKRKSKGPSLPVSVEYYDLPYKYNETVVKVLYQNPTTLFVYWEISDADIENYKNMYGDNFFETTEPVLVVYNESMNYQFEIVINDFANSWYFNINDAECNYHVALVRRPKYNKNYESNYVYITSSNTIESPNDRILYNTNADNSVYFKNTKNNSLRKIGLNSLIEQLNLNNKKFRFPLIKNISDLYKNLLGSENIPEIDILSNPSSGALSSRFK